MWTIFITWFQLPYIKSKTCKTLSVFLKYTLYYYFCINEYIIYNESNTEISAHTCVLLEVIEKFLEEQLKTMALSSRCLCSWSYIYFYLKNLLFMYIYTSMLYIVWEDGSGTWTRKGSFMQAVLTQLALLAMLRLLMWKWASHRDNNLQDQDPKRLNLLPVPKLSQDKDVKNVTFNVLWKHTGIRYCRYLLEIIWPTKRET